jgi:hypothetical protein
MTLIDHVEDLDRVPVTGRVKDYEGRTWQHVRQSGQPWEDPTPAWIVTRAPMGTWQPEAQSDTMHLFFAYGPFFVAECGGRDPAYPGLECYLDSGHPDECEFMTAEVGQRWRQRALEAEKALATLEKDREQIEAVKQYLPLNADHVQHTLSYAATALEGSGDNGDRYCAAQLRAMLKADEVVK